MEGTLETTASGAGSQAPLPRIGVVGLGTMGGGMAARLLDECGRLVVHNRTAARAEPLAARGAEVVADPGEVAAASDVVVLSLADEQAVEQTLFGSHGVLARLPAGGVVVDTSTVSPAFARRTAERVRATGHRLVDACIIGNGVHARQGELRFMVGGEKQIFDEVAPILDVLGKEVRYLGGHGLGASAKVVLNLLMGVEMQMLAEAVVLAQRAGIERGAVLEMISNSGFSSPVMRYKASVMGRGEYGDPQFRLDLMHKDMRLATDEADALGVEAPLCAETRDALAAAAEAGLGDADCAAILAHAESLAGLAPLPGTAG
ncbi:NAD(P)-dependent oxidoreductase [Streptomyces xiaopingdaonensis]|uniref:NAD(P)-dependent oxidoreductase n=1 Tax=Streptomyces xiaopingdaonensis TaxID=1565415 RepID=UPI00030405C4|nr:NAD(P)-dependent oxidoreductase [Streptomyces xiaopingdaonensis]